MALPRVSDANFWTRMDPWFLHAWLRSPGVGPSLHSRKISKMRELRVTCAFVNPLLSSCWCENVPCRISESPWRCDRRVESGPRPIPSSGRRVEQPRYLLFTSSSDWSSSELKLKHQILTPPTPTPHVSRNSMVRPTSFGLSEPARSLEPWLDPRTPAPPGQGMRCTLAAWHHLTELGACVGPGAPLNSGAVGTVLGSGRGQAPLTQEAGGTQASSGACRCPAECVLERDTASASVPFRPGPQRPPGAMLGLLSCVTVGHWPSALAAAPAPRLRMRCLLSEAAGF